MKKLLFAIFAHPDDEAFGPCGTLLMEAKAGTEVHLVSLTAGESGTNIDNLPDLKKIRLEEWNQSGQLIGATGMHYLEFADGMLNNHDMLIAADAIEKLIRAEIEDAGEDVEVELMTNDLNGITGHIDHIVAARATCLVFYRLKKQSLPMKQIRLACLDQKELSTVNIDWLYMEPGRPESQIDQTVDARTHHETILKIMRAHYTQRADGERHIAERGHDIGLNRFLILK